MPIRRLFPAIWGGPGVPSGQDTVHPFSTLQQEMNRMFDDFFERTSLSPLSAAGRQAGAFHPSVDVEEGDAEIVIHAEIPGVEDKDVEVLLEESSMVLKGVKKREKEEKRKGYHCVERSFGSFQRVIPLPGPVDSGKAEARFRNGVLTVVLPKLERTKARGKRIAIQSD